MCAIRFILKLNNASSLLVTSDVSNFQNWRELYESNNYHYHWPFLVEIYIFAHYYDIYK